MFPKMGKTFPDDDEQKGDRLKYRMAIAAALKRELGGSHRAIKIVMRWTGVSERTAKNWIAGSHGPAGEHLVSLMGHSNEVLKVVLKLGNRETQHLCQELADVRSTLVSMVSKLDNVLSAEK